MAGLFVEIVAVDPEVWVEGVRTLCLAPDPPGLGLLPEIQLVLHILPCAGIHNLEGIAVIARDNATSGLSNTKFILKNLGLKELMHMLFDILINGNIKQRFPIVGHIPNFNRSKIPGRYFSMIGQKSDRRILLDNLTNKVVLSVGRVKFKYIRT